MLVKQKSFFLSLMLIGVFFKESIHSGLIIVSAVYTLINYDTLKIPNLKKYIPPILIFIVIVVGVFWSSSIKDALNVLERGHLFITIPLIFSVNRLNKVEIKKIGLYFFYATTIAVLLHFCRTFYLMIYEGSFYFYHEKTKYFHFLYTRLSPFIHPTYFSVAIAYTVFFGINNMNLLKLEIGVVLRNISLMLISFFLLLLLARGAQVMFLITLLPYFLFKRNFVNKKYLLISIAIIVTLLYTFKDHRLLNRYNRFLKLEEISYNEIVKKLPSFGYRLDVLTKVIEEYKYFSPMGRGTGAQQSSLQYILKTNKEVKNTHNQLISFYMQWGVLGLFLYILFFYRAIYIAIRVKNYSAMLFFIFMFLLSFTENIIERQKGIVMLVFVYCILAIDRKLQDNIIENVK